MLRRFLTSNEVARDARSSNELTVFDATFNGDVKSKRHLVSNESQSCAELDRR